MSDTMKTYLKNYDLFIEQLAYLFQEEEHKNYLIELNKESLDKKIERCVNFNNVFSDELFVLFLESDSNKLFSDESVSNSLFGSQLSLKTIFEDRVDSIHFVLWSYLHLMVLMVEMAKKKRNKQRIHKLADVVEKYNSKLEEMKDKANTINKKSNDPKVALKNILGVDMNNETNDMIDDIVKSFEGTLNNINPEKGMPDIGALLPNIIEISQKISSKYSDKIGSGEIELDKLLGGITKNVPGMDNMLKGGLQNISSIMGNMMGKSEPKKTVVIDENFSTANVDLGKQSESALANLNIGKMLNVADSMGMIPSFGKDDKESDSGNQLGNQLPMGDLFGMMNNLNSGNVNPDEMKNKLSGLLNTMMPGFDLEKMTKDIEKSLKKDQK